MHRGYPAKYNKPVSVALREQGLPVKIEVLEYHARPCDEAKWLHLGTLNVQRKRFKLKDLMLPSTPVTSTATA